MSKKKPKAKIKPDTSKNPRIDLQNRPESVIDKKPVWRFGMLDMNGEWGWAKLESRTVLSEIHATIKNFEKMTWAEIEDKKGKKGKHNHSMPTQKICKQARERLKEMELDDIDMLYSLHLTGARRVWGKRDNEAFYIIWWDPDHTVCPVELTHT